MKILLKAMETEEDLTRFMMFCEAHGIDTIARNGYSLSLDMINFEYESVNWGGYGSKFSVSPKLFSYFKLAYPGGDPPRGKSFANVKMVITGSLSKHDVTEITAKVEAEGGVVVSAVDESINLLVTGMKPNAKLVKKAEGLGQVLILDEVRFSALLPAPRKASKKRKASRPIPQTIDKKAFSSLKKLLVSRDIDHVLQGIELLRSLENVDLYTHLLAGVSADEEGSLVLNAMFKGTGPAQPFLNLALLGVIAHAPEECETAVGLRKSVTKIAMPLPSAGSLFAFANIKSLDLSESSELRSLDGLPELKKLRSVDLSGCNSLEDIDGLSGTTGLRNVDLSNCSVLRNLDGLANSTKLSRLNLENCAGLENVDGLSGCSNLTTVQFDFCESLKNVDGLSNGTRFTRLSFEDCSSLENLDGLAGSTNLTALSLQGCTSLENLDGLLKLANLKSLNLDSCWGLENLDGLRKCKSIKDLHLSSSLAHVDGLSHLTGLIELDLSGNDELESLQGLSGCKNLAKLTVNSGALENVDGLSGCANLTELDLGWCSALDNVNGLVGCTKLRSLSLARCEALNNLEGLLKCTDLTYLSLEDCSSLETLDGLENLSKLKVQGWYDYFDLDGCDSLHDVGSLAGCKNIKTVRLGGSAREVLPAGLEKLPGLKALYLSFQENLKHVDQLAGCAKLVEVRLNECKSLENVAGLVGCTKLAELDLKGSKNVKPKPAKLGMNSRIEVAAYMARVEKEFGSDEDTSAVTKPKKATRKKR